MLFHIKKHIFNASLALDSWCPISVPLKCLDSNLNSDLVQFIQSICTAVNVSHASSKVRVKCSFIVLSIKHQCKLLIRMCIYSIKYTFAITAVLFILFFLIVLHLKLLFFLCVLNVAWVRFFKKHLDIKSY